MRILLIENDPEWAAALATMIESLGYQLMGTAHSLSLAEEMLKKQPPDLIIGDVLMNNSSVVEFLQRIPTVHCPVIFATTCTDLVQYELAGQRNDTRYLIKPFHALTLRSAIDSVLRKPAPPEVRKGVAVRGPNNQRVMVAFNTIHYIRVERNYCFLLAQNKKYALKISLAKLLQQLDGRFVQIHKGFCINGDYITRTDLSGNQLFINEEALPIGYNYRKKVVDFLAGKPD
ncbi:LytR/AlgR family response regulator transcription factor [Spirosoma luteum]|uniref:LytR/AlgR family response regulator transcription factor n=1 Tax=Spirosoma luteum TaxID=431553 RepID=UPI000378EC30|nr:response regulator transcription factor [Spirosoma luteum]